MISDVDSCRTMSASNVFTIIQAFANNCYVPEKEDSNENIWSERIVPAMLANENLTQFLPNSFAWLSFTLQLVILGHFDQQLISRVLSRSYLEINLNRRELSTLDLQKVLILYQTVAMRTDIDLTSIDPKMISGICKKYNEMLPSCDIQQDLIDHLGKMYTLTNVRTKYMHLIHTLVKINKQTGQFVQFSDKISYDADGFISLDDISCAENESL